jgi:hypothetical protein
MKTLIMTEMGFNEWRSYENRLPKKSPVTVIEVNNKIDTYVLPHPALFITWFLYKHDCAFLRAEGEENRKDAAVRLTCRRKY